MRTIQILETFEKKQIETVRNYVKANGNESSLKIMDFLCLHRAYEKEMLYKVVYGKKYEKNKDYLLRNEIRKLNEILEEFIVICQIKNPDSKWKVERLKLDYFYNHAPTSFIESELRNALNSIDKEKNMEDFFSLLNFRKFVFSFKLNTTVGDDTMLRRANIIKDTLWDLENIYLAYFFEWIQILENNRTVYNSTNSVPIDSYKYSPSLSKEISEYYKRTQHRIYKSYVYNPDLKAEDRIHYLEKCLTVNYDAMEYLTNKEDLAREYFSLGNISKAYSLTKENLNDFEVNGKTSNLQFFTTLWHYFIFSLYLNKSDDASVTFLKYNSENLKADQDYDYILIPVTLNFLAIRDVERARRYLPRFENPRDKGEIYINRFLEMYCFYMEGDLETSTRLCENAYRALRSTPIEDSSVEKLFLAFKHVLTYQKGDKAKWNRILKYLDGASDWIDMAKKLIVNQHT